MRPAAGSRSTGRPSGYTGTAPERGVRPAASRASRQPAACRVGRREAPPSPTVALRDLATNGSTPRMLGVVTLARSRVWCRVRRTPREEGTRDPARVPACPGPRRRPAAGAGPRLDLQQPLAHRVGRRLDHPLAGHHLRAVHHRDVPGRVVADGHRGLGLAVDRPRPVPRRHALAPGLPEPQPRAGLRDGHRRGVRCRAEHDTASGRHARGGPAGRTCTVRSCARGGTSSGPTRRTRSARSCARGGTSGGPTGRTDAARRAVARERRSRRCRS
jgi:hypothetical protein